MYQDQSQKSHNIVVIPKLLTHLWLKQLNKACDVVFEISPSFDFWNTQMFEPLVIGICFPFAPHRPWQLKGTPKMFSVIREVRRICKQDKMDPRDFLCKLLRLIGKILTMSESMVWKVLHLGSKPNIFKARGLQSPPSGGNRKRI